MFWVITGAMLAIAVSHFVAKDYWYAMLVDDTIAGILVGIALGAMVVWVVS